jgi:hypothetical protein
MKKFINPEMNVNRFDVENIVTGSTSTERAEKQIAETGITIGGNPVTNQGAIVVVF